MADIEMRLEEPYRSRRRQFLQSSWSNKGVKAVIIDGAVCPNDIEHKDTLSFYQPVNPVSLSFSKKVIT